MNMVFRSLWTTVPLGAILLASTQCELMVKLDRGQVEVDTDACAICTDLGEAGDDGGDGAAQDGAGGDLVDAAAADATLDGASE